MIQNSCENKCSNVDEVEGERENISRTHASCKIKGIVVEGCDWSKVTKEGQRGRERNESFLALLLSMLDVLRLTNLPVDILFEVMSYLDLADIAHLQQVSVFFYSFIFLDKFFTYFNTLKFFELFYRNRLFAVFLLPFVNPRYSYIRKRSYSADTDADDTIYQTPPIDFSRGDILRDTQRQDPSAAEIGQGNTIIHLAAANGSVKALERFFELETNDQLFFPTCRGSLFNVSALKFISLKPENINSRLVDMVNSEPNTPLGFISIISDSTKTADIFETVRFLFRVGRCDYEKRGRAGNTALGEAVQHAQLEMTKLLVSEIKQRLQDDLNASQRLSHVINTPNDYNENTVILAVRSSPAILDFILQEGGDANSCRGCTPVIHIVCSAFNLDTDEYSTTQSNSELLRILLRHNANPHIEHQTTGLKPLHTAAFWGNETAIRYLVNVAGIDPDLERNDLNRWFPMHYACRQGQIASITALLDCGASLMEQDEKDEMELDVPAPMDLLHFGSVKTRILEIARSRLKRAVA